MASNIQFLFGFLFLCLLLPGSVLGQSNYLKKDIKIPEHPRILLLKGGEVAIQRTIAKDTTWKKVHQAIITESNHIITLPVLERIQIGRRLLDKSRECLRRVFFLSYAWRMTSEPKYLLRAESELLAVSNFSDWNPSHFLDVAEMTMGVAIGYDWLHQGLSNDSKKIIKESILKKGLEPSFDTKHNGWLKATHNWNQVCNAGMVFGALAIQEENPDLAHQIIERAIKSVKLPMEDYQPDGAYPEGYAYWGYGTSFNVMLLSSLENIYNTTFGLTDNIGFLKTASYLQHLTGTSGESFNYSDCGNGVGLNAAMFWFARRLKNNSLLQTEKNYLAGDEEALVKDRLLPAVLIWGAGMPLNKIKTPKALTWSGKGKNPVAMLRTSWKDPNAIYVGLKGGSPSVNHGHMDVGSFVMDAQGERWAMDFGMQQYESLESKGVDLWNMKQNSQRWDIFRYNNFSHNTLTFNDKLQDVTGFAAITNVTDQSSFLSATTNLSEVYKNEAKSVQRGIAIIDQQYVMIRDEIETTDQATTVRWVMLTSAQVKITKNGTAELTQNNKKLQIKVVSPENITFTTWSTEPKRDFDAPNPGTILVGFEAKIPANMQTAITVLLIPQNIIVKNLENKISALNSWSKRK